MARRRSRSGGAAHQGPPPLPCVDGSGSFAERARSDQRVAGTRSPVPIVEHLPQGAGHGVVRRLAPGRPVLGSRSARRRDRVDRTRAEHRRERRAAGASRQPARAVEGARLARRRRQHAVAGQGIVDEIDEEQAVTLVLAAGEMSIHDVRLAHASAPNRSPERRIGYAIRYVATHVRSHRTPRDTAVLVRGTDTFGHFDPEPL